MVILILAGYANMYAQLQIDSTSRVDSPVVDLKEYNVLEYQQFAFTAGIRTTTLNYSHLQYNQSMSALSDALQQIGPVYMRSYGNNMNNAITIRGFGPERTGILWNGININNAGLGQLDLNLMPGNFFNAIQLIEGSSSTHYGSGAQGGSLLLEFKPDFSNLFNVKIQQEFGSFFSWNTSAQFNYGCKKFQGRTAFLRNSSNNNYPYRDLTTIGLPVSETVNADFFSYQGMQDLFFKMKHNWHLSFHGWYNYTDRKIPPSMGAANNHAQQFDENIRVLAQLRKTFSKHDIQVQMAYIYDELIYHTDAFKDSSSIHTAQLQTQYIYHPKKLFTFMVGGNFQYNYSAYKYYASPVSEFRGNAFALANFTVNDKLKISIGIRQQFSTSYTSYPSAHAGINHVIKSSGPHTLSYRFGVNSAYRMPTLNDLYWVPGGNTSLKPEYSWNVENSWNYQYKKNGSNIRTELLGYFGRTVNWIQWTPTTLGYWTPQNITSVQSSGFESRVTYEYQKSAWKMQLNATYSFTHATDVNNQFYQLIYVPQHNVKGSIEVKWKGFYFNLVPHYTSLRYSLADNTQYIPPFFLLHLNTGYILSLKTCSVGLVGRIGNITNSDYQMVANRPMPGINVNVGVNFYLHAKTTKQKTYED